MRGVFSLKKPAYAIEWRLLAFLVLFMDVKLAVKVFAIVLVFFLHPDFRFGFRIRHSRLPLFYPAAIVLTVLNFILCQNFTANYMVVAFTGVCFWAACILAIHQVKLFAERTDITTLNNTLLAFFAINIGFSLLNLSAILIDTGFRNPFQYQGQYQKYFLNTGDYIKGITFDTSTTNALINCFGAVYFLYQKKYLPVLACLVTLIMTGSNFSNIVLLVVFAGIFAFKSIKEQKSIMVICTLFAVTFLSKVSPQNNTYLNATINSFIFNKKENATAPVKLIPIRERPDSLLTQESRREKIAVLFLDSLERDRLKKIALIHRTNATLTANALPEKPEIPGDSIHTASFQWKRDTTQFQRQLLSYIHARHAHPLIKYENDAPGKILAFRQSIHFLMSNPRKMIAGAGTGNFSSKLAFRATGLKTGGSFPEKYLYFSPDFLDNHLSLYAYFFSQDSSSHSIIHNPASVYDQLLTEYGLIGLAAFAAYYIGFFTTHLKKLSYGIPLLMILLAAFTVDYWFEQLSIVVLFELMMFINIKEQNKIATDE